jgi:hypothetical protein
VVLGVVVVVLLLLLLLRLATLQPQHPMWESCSHPIKMCCFFGFSWQERQLRALDVCCCVFFG